MSCSIEYKNKFYSKEDFRQYVKDNMSEFRSFLTAGKNSDEVEYVLKSIDILLSDKATQVFKSAQKGNWDLEKTLIELQIPTAQRDLIMNLGVQDREDIIIELFSNYSYTVEINTAKHKNTGYGTVEWNNEDGYQPNFDEPDDGSEENAKYYSNLTVPGGTNYTEQEIATPLITPSIKGHAQFSTDNGIGWFRSDDKENKVVGWKEENDFLNSETAQYNPITKDDRVIFGHPTIGKSYLKQKGSNDFITLDDDYANEVNAFIDANRGTETRQEYKGRKPKEYNEFMLNLFDRLKAQAKKEGKRLFVSNTNILKERMSEFDKVITIPKDEFKKRFDARGATYGFEDWKSDIDATVAKVDKSKVISTTGYLSELLEGNPKTRRILEVQSDLFQKGRDKEFLVDNYKHTPGDRNFNVTYEGKEYKVGTMGGMQRVVIYKTLEGQVHYENPKQDWLTQEEIPQGLKDIVSNKFNSLKQEVLTQNKSNKENQFLQLLNKDNNWVTFFIKSIIQDSAKKGYEKVLFPTGNTASKVEGHTTLEAFKKQKEDRIKELESRLNELKNDNFTNLNVFNFAEVNLEEAKKIITNSFINATKEEARLIYRKFSVQYHPDKGGSEELMKHLNDINDKFKNGKLNREKQKINEQVVRKFYEEIKDNLEKHREGEVILGKTYNSNTFKYKNDIKLTSQDFVGGILSNKGYFKVGNFIRYALQNPNLFEADSLEILKNLTKGQYYNSANNLANTSIRVGNPSEFSSINSLGAVFVNKSSTKGYADISEIHINPAYFDIKFFEDSFNNDKFKEFVNTIGHELVHKLTIPDLLSDSTTRKEIEEIYKAAKESYKNYNGIKNNITDYALSNLSEFTANYFNSKEFKDFLKTVIVKSENNKNKSLLDKLITVIARFFNKNYGITEKNAYDYLTSVINNNTFYGVPNKVFVKKGNYSAVNEAIQDEKSNIQNEINQLKQELERVEREGFGALRPIYNFYENTVTNILNKTYGEIKDYSNTPIKNGVDNLFEENKELSKIGNKQLYSAYLDTIFPDSKVKDIVYHGTNAKFDKFDKSKLGTKTINKTNQLGFYFSDKKVAAMFNSLLPKDYYNKPEEDLIKLYNKYSELYGEDKAKEILDELVTRSYDKSKMFDRIYLPDSNFISAVINSKNPLIADTNEFAGGTRGDGTEIANKYKNKSKNNDSIILPALEDGGLGGEEFESENYVVFEPEQIHILGSKQDIEGFKEFVKESSKPKVSQITDEYGNTWNEVNLNKDSKNVIFFDSSIPTKKAVEKIEKIYKPVILHRLQDGSPVIDNTLYMSQGYKYAEKFKKEFGFIPSGVITTQRMMNKNQRSFYVLRINEEALKQKLDGEQQEMFDATIPDLVAALNKTAEEQVVIQDQIDRVKQEAVSVEKKINKIENKFLRSSMRDALKGINSGDTERSLQNFTYFILEVDKVLKYYSDTLKKIRSKPIQDQVGELESAKQLAENFKAIATFLKREFQYIDDRNEFKSLINSLNSNLDQIESIYGRQAEIVSLERVYENLKEDEKIAFKKINDEIQVLTKQIAVANSNGAGKSYRDTLQARLDNAIAKREKFVPTKEMISDTFKGLRGDLGWTSGNLRSALAMGDPIISGYARKLKEGFNKVRRAIIPIREQAFEILQKYESKLGLSRNLPQSKFYEGLFQIQESAFYNEETGKIEKEEHYSLLSPYEERFYSDLLEKQVKVKKLKKASATLEEIKEAEKDLNAFLDTYVERKYKKEWYDRYDLLTPEAAKARQDLLDQEQELLRNSEDTLTDAQLELLHELKHKRKALGSTFNKDGTKKTGDALKMAESIQAFNKETSRMSKWEITPLNREWFKTMLEKKKGQLESGLITQKQFDTWLSLNTQRKISDEFYKERTAILDVIHSIMNKLPKEQFKEDVKALWDEILDSARPYRDEDNITDGTVMDQSLVGSVKEKEDKIEELKSKLVRFSGLTIEEEQELSGLFQSLESLTPQEIQRFMQLKDEQQSYKDYISAYISPVEMSTLMSAFSKLAAISRWVPTTYYVETYNEKLNEFRQKVDPGFLQDIHLIEEQFILQDEWYRANHVTKTVKQYDDFGGVYYSTVDEPLYIWKDIIPTNEAYIEEDAPGSAFRTRMVKPEFMNENYRVDVKGRPIPKRTIETEVGIKKSPYVNEAYDVLRSNSLEDDKEAVKWEMLQFLTKTHLEAQVGNNVQFSNGSYSIIDPDLDGKIPNYKKLGYFLPGVVKTTYDRVLDKGVKGIKEDFKLLFKDTQEDKDLVLGDVSQIDLTFIPIKYSTKIKPEDQELNLLEIILRHRAATEEYQYLESEVGEAKLISSSLKTSNQDVSPSAIDRILKLFKADKFIKSEKHSRRSKVFDEFVRTMFYGETEHAFPSFIDSQKFSTNKVINSFLGLSSLQIMTFNYPAHVVNIISGEIQNILESTGGKYFTFKDYLRAKSLYLANVGNFWEDYSKEGHKSFWGALSERFDVPQGDFMNSLGKKTKFSRLRDMKSHLMMLKSMGEHETQVSVLMAMMNNYKVKLNGNVIPLNEAFDNVRGSVSLKEGVTKIDGSALTDLDLDRFQDRVHGVVRQLQGAYSPFDRTVAEKTLLGKLAFYMRKYFVPMAYRRFETFKYDYEEQEYKEGYYTTTVNLIRDYIKLNKELFSSAGEFNKVLTDVERRNIRIFAAELSTILLLALTVSLMGGGDKDRDLEGKWFKTLALYVFMKAKSEAETFLPVPGAGINELTTLFRSPFAAASTVTTAGRLLNDSWSAALGRDEARFQRDYGIWDEGDLRLKADMLKLAGFNANIITPENLVKNFELRNR